MALMNLFAGRNRNTENRLMDMDGSGEEGEGETNEESSMEACITKCRIDSQ